MIFLDSNIIIDLIETSAKWSIWSRQTVAHAARTNRLAASTVVLAEVAGHFGSTDDQLLYLEQLGANVIPLDAEAAYRAGRAHRAYRRAGGTRASVLADFLIAGQASALQAALLTRDKGRLATYFPKLTLITPDTHP
ncbi:type II toxin-antitoxin system VapC family toxin [uncultured Sphingomonas sp.]|uniref:type II toxin-antitoxin system VapC family toxin n=1 Tax=uncultured Sphingomonas sp. TaxID=158754 RepID=UPI0035C9AC7A